jgi:hypothetical protein
VLFLLTACLVPDEDPTKSDDPVEETLPEDTDTVGPLTCAPPETESICGNEASIVRGRVRLGDGYAPEVTEGNLIVAMTHLTLGNERDGGYYHFHTQVRNVDLADGPVEFELDMCQGGEMWSEDSCGYNLIAFLDTDKDGAGTSPVPEEGEPSARVEFDISCRGDAPCLDVPLDCEEGRPCVKFDSPGNCECGDTCDSIYVGCM